MTRDVLTCFALQASHYDQYHADLGSRGVRVRVAPAATVLIAGRGFTIL
jgi:hypothetical protein